MKDLIDNIAWHALAGPHSIFAIGEGDVRRYAPGFPPIVGFADVDRPNFEALARYCRPGECLYAMDWSGAAPERWQVMLDSTMFRMVWDGGAPELDKSFDAVPLQPEHAAQAVELAALTKPGPFGPRTPELGDYFGCFEGERLVAMAGERMHAGTLREISGVCTHPDFQGKGLARRLVEKLIVTQLQRGETPFLHVMRDNDSAHRMYARMGFRDQCETAVRVITLVG